ncbi:hypothetical protein FOA43_004624 [Brettanomyces nanus]|uniref:RNA polymerase II-associated protein RBA50 n=1 Tax=Eeniella nana TaxID=13502 RepID=A0A875RY82_EENNA|nr:uncharacterized protein FOA43_004624 [Brettanomyces nanus]QPG77217.1 hypothetical protein FOA43_004624 [Brettanomyces nanus]
MNLLGEIVEHDLSDEVARTPDVERNFKIDVESQKPSRWRQRLAKKGLSSTSNSLKADGKEREPRNNEEKEQIARQNLNYVTGMSEQERQQAKEELLGAASAGTLRLLMKRQQRNKKQEQEAHGEQEVQEEHESDSSHASAEKHLHSVVSRVTDMAPTIEGDGTWIGGYTDGRITTEDATPAMPAAVQDAVSAISETGDDSRHVHFNNEATIRYPDSSSKDDWEDIEYLDDEGPSYDDAVRLTHVPPKKAIEHARFHKREDIYKSIDLNDPNFNQKLHDKFFPDLPSNFSQLQWMSNKHVPKTPTDISYDSLDDLRFDFDGEIITSANIKQHSQTTSDGLHNHSAHPELPGYTLPELSQYLRSTYPGQRCIASRTLGRIMHKLGTLRYSVTEVTNKSEGGPEKETNKNKGESGLFEKKCWELVLQLGILDILNSSAADTEKNITVKNYAIEALWLWTQGGGEDICKKVAEGMERERKTYQV